MRMATTAIVTVSKSNYRIYILASPSHGGIVLAIAWKRMMWRWHALPYVTVIQMSLSTIFRSVRFSLLTWREIQFQTCRTGHLRYKLSLLAQFLSATSGLALIAITQGVARENWSYTPAEQSARTTD